MQTNETLIFRLSFKGIGAIRHVNDSGKVGDLFTMDLTPNEQFN